MNTNTVIKMENLEIEGMQTREGMNDAVVRSYAREMADGVVFDPPVVFFDGTKHYLADGFHRIAAMKRRGETEVAVEVREGTRTDALRFALTANAKHGLKRTPADIHHCLAVAWQNRVELFGGEPSYEVLARACVVSKRTVLRFFNRRKASIGDTVTNSEIEAAGDRSIGDSVTNSEIEAVGDRSIGDSVTNSESATLVSTDGKKRKSLKGTRSRKQPAKAVEPVETGVIEKAVPKFKGHVFATTALAFAEQAGHAPVFTEIDPSMLPEVSPYSGRTHEQIEKGLDRYNMPIPKAISQAFDESCLAIYDGIANNVRQAMDAFSDYGGKMVFRPLMYDRDGEYDEFDTFPGELKSAWTSLKLGRPHCVCPECAGNRKIEGEMCDACHGHGFMTQADYHWWIIKKINKGDDEEWTALKKSLYFVPFEELAVQVQKLRERAWNGQYNAYGIKLPADNAFPETTISETGWQRLDEVRTVDLDEEIAEEPTAEDVETTSEEDPFANEPTAEDAAKPAEDAVKPAETPAAAKPTEEAPRPRLPWEAVPGTKQGDWEPIEDIMDQMEAVAF